MRYALVLAGGGGTRLWPLSRRAKPKQFLRLGDSGPTLLQAAVARGAAMASDVVVVTADRYRELTRAEAPTATVLAEPMPRNTAAAIGIAAVWLLAQDPDAVIGVLPADQHVGDEAALQRVIELAWRTAEERDAICTLGILPTRAESGFGYLALTAADAGQPVRRVARFVEKPDPATAQCYATDGLHLWNAGMFFARAARLRREITTHLPELGRGLDVVAAALDAEGEAGFARALAEVYPGLPAISIDHGVMEKCGDILTIPANVGWDDVGSFASLPALLPGDADGNVLIGDGLVTDGTGNLVMSDAGVVVVAGLSDVVVVRHGDAVLVLPRGRAQDVRGLIEQLIAAGLDRHL